MTPAARVRGDSMAMRLAAFSLALLNMNAMYTGEKDPHLDLKIIAADGMVPYQDSGEVSS